MAIRRVKPAAAATAQSSTARRVVENAVSEKDWQQQVIDLAQLLGWLYFHTYDSRRSSGGFPDLVLVRERVVFAELKSGSGRLTAAQHWWIASLSVAGAEVYVWQPSDWPQVEQTLRRGEP